MCSRNSRWYWRERKRVLETFHVKWNFVINVNCDCNKYIRKAITITFPGKQTIMKHDMNKFNLNQFECRIQNLINLLVNRKKLNVFFPASVILNITNQSYHHFSVLWHKLFPEARWGCYCASLRAWTFFNEPEPFFCEPRKFPPKISKYGHNAFL